MQDGREWVNLMDDEPFAVDVDLVRGEREELSAAHYPLAQGSGLGYVAADCGLRPRRFCAGGGASSDIGGLTSTGPRL